MFRTLKRILGIYEPHHEYWIPLRNINIIPAFWESEIGTGKWAQKLSYYQKTGQFQSVILLKRDFTLVDGYSAYLIARLYDLGKVPVQFVASK